MGKFSLVLKILGFGSVWLMLVIFLGQLIFDKIYPSPPQITYGVTFSPPYARYLGLDWQKVFLSSLDDLNLKNLRIPTYWSEIEKNMDEFDFSEVDFMLDQANQKNARVLLVVGFRQPRWPECYPPPWVKGLTLEQKRVRILQFIEKTVSRYKDQAAVWGFQVENEPFLRFFGKDCDKGDIGFLTQEVSLVEGLSEKPIIISDSGELGFWMTPMRLSDIFGTTLYREVYNPVIGYFSYPIAPYLYNLKSQIIQKIFAPQNQKTIIVELQAEPWIVKADLAKNFQKQAQFFPVEKFKSYVDYAKKTGFDTQYLWGVEWWYFMKEHGYPQYLEYAKTLF